MATIAYNKIVAVPSSGNKNPAAPKAADTLNLSLAESSIQIGAGGFFKVLDSVGVSLVRAENTAFTVAQPATFSSDLTVTGNLTVNGTTTTVNSTNVSIKDNIIVLNDGEVGPGVSLGTSGISIDRGASGAAVILWDEASDKFNLKVGTSYADLVIKDLSAVGATLTGNLAAVDATLSGDLAAVDATLSGDLSAVGGTFSGNIAAVDATLSGDLAAVDATLSGNIAAVDATLSGDLAAVDATLSGNLAAVDGTFSGNIAAVDATLSGNIAAVDAAFSGAVHFTKSDDTLSIALPGMAITDSYALDVDGGAHFDGHALFARASGSNNMSGASVTPDFMVAGKALYFASSGDSSNPDLLVRGYSKFNAGFAVAAEAKASIAITGESGDAISFSTITNGHIHLDAAKILRLSASVGIATNHTANAGAAVSANLAVAVNASGAFVAISAAAKNALVLGVSVASIENGTSSKGKVAEFGKVEISYETGAFIAVGDMLYLSATGPGKVTNVIPTAEDSTAYLMGVALESPANGKVVMALHRQFLYNN